MDQAHHGMDLTARATRKAVQQEMARIGLKETDFGALGMSCWRTWNGGAPWSCPARPEQWQMRRVSSP